MSKSKFEQELEALPYLAAGNFAAFNFIYYKYSQGLYANIRKFIKHEGLAEDILQDVFLTLWEHRSKIDTDRPVGGWLFTVSYHKSVAELKKQLKNRLMQTDQSCNTKDPELFDNKEADYQRKIRLLEEAVNCLPEKKQAVYRLSKFERKKPEEISKALGLTVVSVKHYIKQSTRKIKEYVQYKYPMELVLFCILTRFL